MSIKENPRLVLFPLTTEINKKGNLAIGGCDTVSLAKEFGTPLYVFDELTIRHKCGEFRDEFSYRYPTHVLYASKAFTNKSLLRILNEEGLGLDVVSGGELGIARAAGFPLDKVYFHGNNKSEEELKLALGCGIGRIVVDNFHELTMLDKLAKGRGRRQEILLRLAPGIDPHTHKFITTGIVDSKFGFLLADIETAISQAMSSHSLNLVGIHTHLGSLINEVEPYLMAIDVVLDLAKKMMEKLGLELKELNIGGGFPVQYTLDTPVTPVCLFAEAIAAKLTDRCDNLGLECPHLIIEPGRAIVAQAGVALYTVGAIKDIPGIRRYVSVDGGMGDNIRPAIYGSRYEALIANKPAQNNNGPVTISGKFCESGDILIKDIELPPVAPGDIIAIPDSGAYCIPMSSNYNASVKPPIVMARDGKARLIRRRETIEDLIRCET